MVQCTVVFPLVVHKVMVSRDLINTLVSFGLIFSCYLVKSDMVIFGTISDQTMSYQVVVSDVSEDLLRQHYWKLLDVCRHLFDCIVVCRLCFCLFLVSVWCLCFMSYLQQNE